MSWHLRKSWHLRTKRSRIDPIKLIGPIEPSKRNKPIRLTQPTKPIAPIGFQYYWQDD
jgi:hypothetical protein